MPKARHPAYFWFRGVWKQHSLNEQLEIIYHRPSHQKGSIRGSLGFLRMIHDATGSCVMYEGVPIPVTKTDPLSIWALANKTMLITESGGNVPTMDEDERTRYLCGRLSFGTNTNRSKIVVSA